MIRQPATHLIGVGIILAACLTGGCRPRLSPSDDAIVEYLRNARVHGKVRRVWPQGQEYVNAVLKADAELQKELKPLRELAVPDALWPHDDARWQDELECAAAARKLVEHCEARQPTRRALLGKLGEAIEKTPGDLDLTAANAKAAFVDRVWEALAILDVDLRNGDVIRDLEEVAARHLELIRAVQGCAGDFDADRPGLNFKDAADQGNVDGQYTALQRRLREAREVLVSYAEQKLAEIAPQLKTVDKNSHRGEYEYLSYKSTYLKGELGAIPKELRAAIKKTQEEIEQLESEAAEAGQKAKAKLQAKIEVRRKCLEQYRADLQNWKPRVEAIIKHFKEASQPERRPAE